MNSSTDIPNLNMRAKNPWPKIKFYSVTVTWVASGPFRPGPSTYSTFVPSWSAFGSPSTLFACTKISLPPSSGVMKPKLFWTLKNLTVPFVFSKTIFLLMCMNSSQAKSNVYSREEILFFLSCTMMLYEDFYWLSISSFSERFLKDDK